VVCNPKTVCLLHRSWIEEENAKNHKAQLGLFREVHDVRDLRLVLCADVSDCMVEIGMGTLKRVVKDGQLPYEPLIICERRALRVPLHRPPS